MRPSAPGRDAQRAHLPAGAARHRRRRRHERLRRRDGPRSWPAAASRWRSSPGPRTAASRPVVELAPGVLVRHVAAGPYEGLRQGGPARPAVRLHRGRDARRGRARARGYYDLVHSHYWLSGQVGWLAADRWGVPLVHTMHTMARVKNAAARRRRRARAAGREIGEEQVVEAADRLVANTDDEARELVELYDADPGTVRRRAARAWTSTASRPGDRGAARAAARPARGRRRCCSSSAGSSRSRRPTCSLRAAAELLRAPPGAARPARRGGPRRPERHRAGAPRRAGASSPTQLGIADAGAVPAAGRPARALVQWYRAADLVAVPVAQRVVRAGRRRGPGLRHAGGRRRRRRAAHGGRATPACSSTGTTPPTGPTALEALLLDPRAAAATCRAGPSSTPPGSAGTRTADRLLEVYAEALPPARATVAPIGERRRRLSGVHPRRSIPMSRARGAWAARSGPAAGRSSPYLRRGRGPPTWERSGARDGEFVVALPGEKKLKTVVSLVIGASRRCRCRRSSSATPTRTTRRSTGTCCARNLRLPGSRTPSTRPATSTSSAGVPAAGRRRRATSTSSSGSCSPRPTSRSTSCWRSGFLGLDAEGVGLAGLAGRVDRNLEAFRHLLDEPADG